MKTKLILVTPVLALLAISAFATYGSDPPPGSIKLLSGYKHKTEQGIDTRVGRIWKEDGLTIEYDIGFSAGHYAKPGELDKYSWYKEQVIGKQSLRCALTRDSLLIVTFPDASANFFAKVKRQEDIAEVLLMVLTYHGKRPRL
jgi:hypothetical protein